MAFMWKDMTRIEGNSGVIIVGLVKTCKNLFFIDLENK